MIELLRLFAPSLAALVCLALVAPLVGAFLHARGAAMHGLALPQVALLGMAAGAALEAALGHDVLHGEHAGHVGAFGWAALGALAGLFALAVRRGAPGGDASRAAAVFAVASAAVVLLTHQAPLATGHVEALARGEVLGVGGTELGLVAVVCFVAGGIVLLRWRRFALVGQDRQEARVIGLSPAREDLLLALATGLVTVVGTATLGPLPVFGLLVLPALAAARGARSMGAFVRRSAACGLVGAASGAVVAFAADLPVGASVVGGCALAAVLLWSLSRWSATR